MHPLEWDNLDIAEDYLEQGMDLCRQGGLDGIFIGKIRMSRLRQAKGDLSGALEEIQIPQKIHRADNFDIILQKIRIAHANGDINQAEYLAAPLVEMLDCEPDPCRYPCYSLKRLRRLSPRSIWLKEISKKH